MFFFVRVFRPEGCHYLRLGIEKNMSYGGMSIRVSVVSKWAALPFLKTVYRLWLGSIGAGT
jgi:hypothetical protein